MTTATFEMSSRIENAVSRILEEISTTRFSTKRGDWPDPKDFKKAKATPGCSAELSCNSEDIQVNFAEERLLQKSKALILPVMFMAESVGQRPLVEVYQEYDIDKMEDRAHKFSDVVTLKRRARR